MVTLLRMLVFNTLASLRRGLPCLTDYIKEAPSLLDRPITVLGQTIV